MESIQLLIETNILFVQSNCLSLYAFAIRSNITIKLNRLISYRCATAYTIFCFDDNV